LRNPPAFFDRLDLGIEPLVQGVGDPMTAATLGISEGRVAAIGELDFEASSVGRDRDILSLPGVLQIQESGEDIDIARGTSPPLCLFVQKILPTPKREGPLFDSTRNVPY
jgi:hypothetical protein